ncbi:Adenylosuccinate lyase [Campylobacter jejuni]|nr:hypothetical protein THJ026_16390 [Campylobacter jejuni]CAG2536269.1 hypothetical protein NVI_CJUN_00135 [Campylobacter jejuni subsp. jejuni]CKG99788.1 Adenylosuccinate lyase [Campylobacter jejuni]
MTGISVFDHRLLADSWSTQEMRAIFCEQNRIQKWLDVEAALAKAQAKLKIIPKKAADEIAKKLIINLWIWTLSLLNLKRPNTL